MGINLKLRRGKVIVAVLILLLIIACISYITVWNPVVSISVVFLIDSTFMDYHQSSTTDLFDWVEYLEFSGVNRIYMYDAYEHRRRAFRKWARDTFPPDVLIYHDWSLYQFEDTAEQQRLAYSHALSNFDDPTEWKIILNINEYPFSRVDKARGFLRRFLLAEIKKQLDLSQLIFQSVQFIGPDSGDNEAVYQRMTRRKAISSEGVFTQLFRTGCATLEIIEGHQIELNCGSSKTVGNDYMRINQYRSTRVENVNDDKSEAGTIYDNSALDISILLKS